MTMMKWNATTASSQFLITKITGIIVDEHSTKLVIIVDDNLSGSCG